MDEGLDTGPVFSRRAVEITEDDDSGSLHDKLAKLGADLIVATLAEIAGGSARPEPQPEDGVTYARKIGKEDVAIDWEQDNVAIDRRIRAMRPSPGARTQVRGEAVKLWRARCMDAPGAAPGTGMGGRLIWAYAGGGTNG